MEFISKVVELISAFRAETRQDAITPDSLGSLLLRMINALRYAWSSSTHCAMPGALLRILSIIFNVIRRMDV